MAQTNSSGNETSLKQLFQSMIPEGSELMEGTVIQVDPLKIQMTNDEKLIITDRITVVPWHLTDYKTQMSFDDPSVRQVFTTWDMAEISESAPAKISMKTIIKHKITVYNALRLGDKLHILALNNGKLYYVLDRVAGQEVI